MRYGMWQRSKCAPKKAGHGSSAHMHPHGTGARADWCRGAPGGYHGSGVLANFHPDRDLPGSGLPLTSRELPDRLQPGREAWHFEFFTDEDKIFGGMMRWRKVLNPSSRMVIYTYNNLGG